MGGVVKSSPRATTVVTNDNIAIIVPSSEFISSSVTNWNHSDRNVRLRIPVGVAYSSDPEVVRALLVEVANTHQGVLKQPPPDVVFLGFGDSSLDFELRVWTIEYITQSFILRSDLYFSMWNKLKEKRIEIPFPQRDLHIRSGVMNAKKHYDSNSCWFAGFIFGESMKTFERIVLICMVLLILRCLT
jgi:small-conductance mechanosensitive channel